MNSESQSQSRSRILPTSWYQSQSRILANSGRSITKMTVKYSELSIFLYYHIADDGKTFDLAMIVWVSLYKWQSRYNSLGLTRLVLVSVSPDWSQSWSRILPIYWSQSQILAHCGLSLKFWLTVVSVSSWSQKIWSRRPLLWLNECTHTFHCGTWIN